MIKGQPSVDGRHLLITTERMYETIQNPWVTTTNLQLLDEFLNHQWYLIPAIA